MVFANGFCQWFLPMILPMFLPMLLPIYLTSLFISFSATKELLPVIYATRERGKIMVKGKGEMTTFWLESKANRNPPQQSEVFYL
jgi:hypothetical protein